MAPWLFHDFMTTMNWTCPVAVIRQMSGDVQRPGSDESAKLHNGCGRLEDLLWLLFLLMFGWPLLSCSTSIYKRQTLYSYFCFSIWTSCEIRMLRINFSFFSSWGHGCTGLCRAYLFQWCSLRWSCLPNPVVTAKYSPLASIFLSIFFFFTHWWQNTKRVVLKRSWEFEVGL